MATLCCIMCMLHAKYKIDMNESSRICTNHLEPNAATKDLYIISMVTLPMQACVTC
jgi:hypothetical protein